MKTAIQLLNLLPALAGVSVLGLVLSAAAGDGPAEAVVLAATPTPAVGAPLPEGSPAALAPTGASARAPEPADVRVQQELAVLEARLAAEQADQQEAAAWRARLLQQKEAEALELRIASIDCGETLCRVRLEFPELRQRDRHFRQLLRAVDTAYFAHVADGRALSASLYVARADHELLPRDEPDPARASRASQR